MGFKAKLGGAARQWMTGKKASSGPQDGPQLQRKDSAIGAAMRGVMKLGKRSKAKAGSKGLRNREAMGDMA